MICILGRELAASGLVQLDAAMKDDWGRPMGSQVFKGQACCPSAGGC